MSVETSASEIAIATVETAPEETPGAKPDGLLVALGLVALKSEREAKAAAKKRAAAAEARIKEFEDARKTESEKQAEALAKAKAELAELTVAKTRAEVAAAKGVPADLLNGSTQEELEASADALIAFKGVQEPQKLIVPNDGGSPDLALNGAGLEAALKKAVGIQ